MTTKTKTTNKKVVGSFTISEWKNLLTESVALWPSFILPYAGIFFLALLLQIAGLALFAIVFLLLAGGLAGLENTVANLQIAGSIPDLALLWSGGALFIAWLTWAIVAASMSKIAHLGLLRAVYTKKAPRVLHLLFKEGWQRCWDYLWLSLRVFFYVMWPLLGVGVLGLGLYGSYWLSASSLTANGPEVVFSGTWGVVSLSVLGLLGAAAIVYMIYAAIMMLFTLPVFAYTGNNASKTFTTVKKIMRQQWWFVFVSWMLFLLPLYALNVGFELLIDFDPTGWVTNLLAFLVGVFIFAPITLAFQYGLMLQTAKNQSVKLTAKA